MTGDGWKWLLGNSWPYLVGYGIAVFVGHFVIGTAIRWIWQDAAGGQRPAAQERLSAVLGSLERGLYVAALQLHYAQFIAIWLGIKTAGRWTSWQEGVKAKDIPGFRIDVSGRHIFNIFLAGSLLNLAYAALGERLIQWLAVCPRDWNSAIPAMVGAAILSIVLLIYVRPRCEGREAEEAKE